MTVSVVIPVFNEDESLPFLLSQFKAEDEYEIIIVDDSPDELTINATEPFKENLNLKIIHRGRRLGLSSAVIEGFSSASGDILVCMDGDGSHPVEIIPNLAAALEECDMVIASRYIEGGSLDPRWNLMRRIISKTCCLLAAPLIRVKDPMSGYFAVTSGTFTRIKDRLKPVSYKIALEIAVRGRLEKISETPFHFASRFKGSSKVTLKVITGMVFHLLSLYFCKIFGKRM